MGCCFSICWSVFISYIISCCHRNLTKTVYGSYPSKVTVIFTLRVLCGSCYNICYNINCWWIVFFTTFNGCYRRTLRKTIDSLHPPLHVSYFSFRPFVSTFLPFLLQWYNEKTYNNQSHGCKCYQPPCKHTDMFWIYPKFFN